MLFRSAAAALVALISNSAGRCGHDARHGFIEPVESLRPVGAYLRRHLVFRPRLRPGFLSHRQARIPKGHKTAPLGGSVEFLIEALQGHALALQLLDDGEQILRAA